MSMYIYQALRWLGEFAEGGWLCNASCTFHAPNKEHDWGNTTQFDAKGYSIPIIPVNSLLRHINAKELIFSSGSYLLNASRGSVVVIPDLVQVVQPNRKTTYAFLALLSLFPLTYLHHQIGVEEWTFGGCLCRCVPARHGAWQLLRKLAMRP